RTLLVQGLFTSLLGRPRPPSAAEVGPFVAQLAAGATVEQIKATILSSPEYFQVRAHGTNLGFLQALYADVLGRGLDPSGQATFGGMLNAGISRGTVAMIVLSSTEALNRLVQAAYQHYLRRPADPNGLLHFRQLLQQGLPQSANFIVGDPPTGFRDEDLIV